MPYINTEGRFIYADALAAFPPIDEPGELNYIVTSLCGQYINEHGICLRYHTVNDVIGMLECVKLELYRRLAAPYEDSKVLENGDLPLYARMGQ